MTYIPICDLIWSREEEKYVEDGRKCEKEEEAMVDSVQCSQIDGFLGDVINDITDDEEGNVSTDQTLLWNMRLLLELRDLPRLSEMHS